MVRDRVQPVARTTHHILVRISTSCCFERRPVALSVVAALACVTPLLGMVPSASADGDHCLHPSTSRPAGRPDRRSTRRRATWASRRRTARCARRGDELPQPRQGRAVPSIRRRILNNINSTWGGPRDSLHAALAGNGTIRMTTWTFFDMGIAKALVKAHRRGVSVQILAATDAQQGQCGAELPAQEPATKLYHSGHKRDAGPLELRPHLQGLMPRRRRDQPLQVLPLHQRRLAATVPKHHHVDVDERDHVRRDEPVERGNDDVVGADLRRSSCRSSRSRASTGRPRVAPTATTRPATSRACSSRVPARPPGTTR